MNLDSKPETATEALKRWDDGENLFTVEMGGLGPGYEQCIHLLVFELIRDQIGQPLPSGDKFVNWGDATIRRLAHNGFSGAQVGAAKNLALHYLRDGYRATIDSFESERKIQVSNVWPRAEKSA